MDLPLHIIILAAGDGTRMKSRQPKVLHIIAGRPLIVHVLDTALSLGAQGIHVVFNPESREVREACAAWDVEWAEQAQRLGTGHAVMQAMPGIPVESSVMVLYGDTPLVPAAVLSELTAGAGQALGFVSMNLEDPSGYGRVIRDPDGRVTGIVEEGETSAEQKAIREVNSGILLAGADKLSRWLKSLGNDNSQGECYLTDIFALAHSQGVEISSVFAPDASLLAGVNDRIQLAALDSRFRQIAAAALMAEGVQIADPERVDIRGQVEAGSDVRIDINVILEGRNRLGDGVSIGPGCVLKDCSLAAGTRVHPYSVLEGVRTHGECDVGPFARLRPGTSLGAGSRVGNFVEVKNTILGEGSKASHLSYLGDSEIGKNVNIGAGTITCNYDGVNKYKTVIGDGAFIGSDSQLVAPVTVGEDANIGAGTTLTKDAPAGKLTISRAKQVTVPGWKRPKKRD